jgi:hypothetical protein
MLDRKPGSLLYQPAGIVAARVRMSTETRSFSCARSQSEARWPAFFTKTNRQLLIPSQAAQPVAAFAPSPCESGSESETRGGVIRAAANPGQLGTGSRYLPY